MKNMLLFTIALTLTLSTLVYAQENGIQKEYFPTGDVQYERVYKNGVKHGLSKSYHENGNLFQEVMYVAGKKQGELKTYSSNGELESIFTLKDDVREGLVQKFNKDGTLAHEHNYVNGMPDGKTQKVWEYHPNGKLKYEYSYYAGDGYRKEYFDNGQLMKKFDIKGARFFNFQEFDKDGTIINDQKGPYEGTLSTYDENGDLATEQVFTNGVLSKTKTVKGGQIVDEQIAKMTSYNTHTAFTKDEEYPYIGLWKSDCSSNFGMTINKAENGLYSLMFCGPGGCMDEKFWLKTTFENDKKFKIIDKDTFKMHSEGLFIQYHRCSS